MIIDGLFTHGRISLLRYIGFIISPAPNLLDPPTPGSEQLGQSAHMARSEPPMVSCKSFLEECLGTVGGTRLDHGSP